MGRHDVKASFDYRRLATSGAGLNCPTGCYTFNADSSLATSNTGTDLADLLLGIAFDRQADTASTLTDFIPYYGWYVQDNFRMNSKITINAGLRWEHESGVQEEHNGLIVAFNQSATNALASQVPVLNLKGAVEYASMNGAPTSIGHCNGSKWVRGLVSHIN